MGVYVCRTEGAVGIFLVEKVKVVEEVGAEEVAGGRRGSSSRRGNTDKRTNNRSNYRSWKLPGHVQPEGFSHPY